MKGTSCRASQDVPTQYNHGSGHCRAHEGCKLCKPFNAERLSSAGIMF